MFLYHVVKFKMLFLCVVLREPRYSSVRWAFCPVYECRGELTHLKRSWCWKRLKAGGEGDGRGWDGWVASPTQWTWVWVNSGSWRWTGKPGVLQSMGSQRVRHDWATELNWTDECKGEAQSRWWHSQASAPGTCLLSISPPSLCSSCNQASPSTPANCLQAWKTGRVVRISSSGQVFWNVRFLCCELSLKHYFENDLIRSTDIWLPKRRQCQRHKRHRFNPWVGKIP